MSDYTIVSCHATEDQLKQIKSILEAEWDAYSITPEENDCYDIMISELDLQESMRILNEIANKVNIVLFVEYGIINNKETKND